jgi:hypothetical protein
MRGAPPERVGRAHPADQVTDFGTRLGSSKTARSPSPVNAKALAMPSEHGRRFDEYQGVEELRPHSLQPHPEQTAGQVEVKAAARALSPQAVT